MATIFAYGVWDGSIGYLGTIISRYSNMGMEIQKDLQYIDCKGEKKMLRLLLDTVEHGDKIVIGTISNLMEKSVPDLISLLKSLYNKGVEIESCNEPHCGVVEFIEILDIVKELVKIESDFKSQN